MQGTAKAAADFRRYTLTTLARKAIFYQLIQRRIQLLNKSVWKLMCLTLLLFMTAPTAEARNRGKNRLRNDSAGQAGMVTTYKMRQKLVSIGKDFWIKTDDGKRAFKVNGKAIRVRNTLVFEDKHGQPLCQIQTRVAKIKDSMEIEGPQGHGRIAIVKKAIVDPLRDRFDARIRNGHDLDIQGNFLDHEYTIKNRHKVVAEISKKWFRIADSYGVKIQPGQDDVIILAITTAIDMMAHKQR